MRVARVVSIFVCVLFATSFAFASDVHIDYDHSANFSKYRTFTLLKDSAPENSLMEDRIAGFVTNRLMAKGLKPVPADADLNVRVKTSTVEKQVLNTYYDGAWGPGWGWGWGGPGWAGPGWATTYVNTYLEATTVVDLLDATSEKMVWRGTATGSISHKPEKAAKKYAKRIAEMFEEYPPFTGRISD
jgi:Domain of unknown function (DUF4136)